MLVNRGVIDSMPTSSTAQCFAPKDATYQSSPYAATYRSAPYVSIYAPTYAPTMYGSAPYAVYQSSPYTIPPESHIATPLDSTYQSYTAHKRENMEWWQDFDPADRPREDLEDYVVYKLVQYAKSERSFRFPSVEFRKKIVLEWYDKDFYRWTDKHWDLVDPIFEKLMNTGFDYAFIPLVNPLPSSLYLGDWVNQLIWVYKDIYESSSRPWISPIFCALDPPISRAPDLPVSRSATAEYTDNPVTHGAADSPVPIVPAAAESTIVDSHVPEASGSTKILAPETYIDNMGPQVRKALKSAKTLTPEISLELPLPLRLRGTFEPLSPQGSSTHFPTRFYALIPVFIDSRTPDPYVLTHGFRELPEDLVVDLVVDPVVDPVVDTVLAPTPEARQDDILIRNTVPKPTRGAVYESVVDIVVDPVLAPLPEACQGDIAAAPKYTRGAYITPVRDMAPKPTRGAIRGYFANTPKPPPPPEPPPERYILICFFVSHT
ncbi:hypothetical protein TSTA_073500 [Talaromyces stipitatus ATCC 10500]|uniref:Uncharacterized protein n=1 Tax=Talaromyces stipitatus (strain ATCC 10500 / CBS 375.48 / QM 6759 / NRRL 1006) TaxID=441959 RepID=B8LVE3_TALSN|nr:uncharacterized protein TSTA_073500 [Talaromyces stipitatus ATCC 10500]EED23962.1 hypothetical protein TSTA_073500 [Talaromyces stipitatus ATCC 10500]